MSCVSLHAMLITPALRFSEEKLRAQNAAVMDLTVHVRYKKNEGLAYLNPHQ